jgi:prephenate dehydrogenase
MTFNTIGFIGLGLIGGSVAKSIKRVHPEITIVGYNRNQDVLHDAFLDGIVDIKSDDSLEAFRECDLIFLCVPVVTALDFMDRLRHIKKESAILTDVGSVKTGIHKYVEERGMTDCFIGGHPMAGSEKTGYANSSDRLIENAWYILTPAGDVDVHIISDLSTLISSTGALPLIMTYEEHDHVTAAISHLPHVISASLVNLVHDQDGPEHYMKLIAAGGFRDITRISSSSPQMWQEICLDNPDNICAMMDAYISKLIDYRLAIRNENAEELLNIFTQCKDYRDSFDTEPKGSLPGEHRIYVDIADEPGAIAQIATMLAMHNISIKNIGIVHNREFEQGVLRIVFYEKDAKESAIRVLEDRNYYVHKE